MSPILIAVIVVSVRRAASRRSATGCGRRSCSRTGCWYGAGARRGLCLAMGLAIGAPAGRPLIGALGGMSRGCSARPASTCCADRGALRYDAMFVSWCLLWDPHRRTSTDRFCAVRTATARSGAAWRPPSRRDSPSMRSPGCGPTGTRRRSTISITSSRWTVAFLPGFLAPPSGLREGRGARSGSRPISTGSSRRCARRGGTCRARPRGSSRRALKGLLHRGVPPHDVDFLKAPPGSEARERARIVVVLEQHAPHRRLARRRRARRRAARHASMNSPSRPSSTRQVTSVHAAVGRAHARAIASHDVHPTIRSQRRRETPEQRSRHLHEAGGCRRPSATSRERRARRRDPHADAARGGRRPPRARATPPAARHARRPWRARCRARARPSSSAARPSPPGPARRGRAPATSARRSVWRDRTSSRAARRRPRRRARSRARAAPCPRPAASARSSPSARARRCSRASTAVEGPPRAIEITQARGAPGRG